MSLTNKTPMHKSETLAQKVDDTINSVIKSNLYSKSENLPGQKLSGYQDVIKKCEDAAKKYIDLPWNSLDSPTPSEEMLKIPDNLGLLAPCEKLSNKWEHLSDSENWEDNPKKKWNKVPYIAPPSPPSDIPQPPAGPIPIQNWEDNLKKKQEETPPCPPAQNPHIQEVPPTPIQSQAPEDCISLQDENKIQANARNYENMQRQVEDNSQFSVRSHYPTSYENNYNNCGNFYNPKRSPSRSPQLPRSPESARRADTMSVNYQNYDMPMGNPNVCEPPDNLPRNYQDFNRGYPYQPPMVYAPQFYGGPLPNYYDYQRPCGAMPRSPANCCGSTPQQMYGPCTPVPQRCDGYVWRPPSPCPSLKKSENEVQVESEVTTYKDPECAVTVQAPSAKSFPTLEEDTAQKNDQLLTPKVSDTQRSGATPSSASSNGEGDLLLQLIPPGSRFSDYGKMSEIPQMVRVVNAVKSGKIVEFYVETLRLKDETPQVTIRIHENFLWLQNNLQSQLNIAGIILPPLPEAPTPSMLTIDVPMQHDLADKTGIFLCDYQENCVGYETFLNVCLSHPRLGSLRLFEKFLFEKEIPVTMKPKRNIFSSLAKVVEDFRLSSFEEHDEDFEYFAKHNADCLRLAQDAVTKFEDLVDKDYKLAKSYDVINYYLKSLRKLEHTPEKMIKWFDIMMGSLDYSSNLRTMIIKNRQRTVGAALKFNSGFMDSLQDALNRRIQKALELISAQSTFERASPQKQEKILDPLKKLQKEFIQMNQMTKPEVARFHRQRTSAVKESMTNLAKSEIRIAQEGIAALTKIYDEASLIPV